MHGGNHLFRITLLANKNRTNHLSLYSFFEPHPPAAPATNADMSRIDFPTNCKCKNPSKGLWLMELTTDDYPWETSYAARDANTGDVVMAGPPAGRKYERNKKYVGSVCVRAGEYLLEVEDMGKDGICCSYVNGSMVVKVKGRVVATIGDSDYSSFRRYVTVEVAGTAGDMPSPTKKPTMADLSESQLYSIDIKVETDSYGEETGYKFAKVNGGGAGPLIDMEPYRTTGCIRTTCWSGGGSSN